MFMEGVKTAVIEIFSCDEFSLQGVKGRVLVLLTVHAGLSEGGRSQFKVSEMPFSFEEACEMLPV